MRIKNDKKMLDKQVALWVNSADWDQFKKTSQDLMGLNSSQAISFLVKLFNRKGDLTGISHIIVEALKPVVERELAKGIKKVAKKNTV